MVQCQACFIYITEIAFYLDQLSSSIDSALDWHEAGMCSNPGGGMWKQRRRTWTERDDCWASWYWMWNNVCASFFFKFQSLNANGKASAKNTVVNFILDGSNRSRPRPLSFLLQSVMLAWNVLHGLLHFVRTGQGKRSVEESFIFTAKIRAYNGEAAWLNRESVGIACGRHRFDPRWRHEMKAETDMNGAGWQTLSSLRTVISQYSCHILLFFIQILNANKKATVRNWVERRTVSQ